MQAPWAVISPVQVVFDHFPWWIPIRDERAALIYGWWLQMLVMVRVFDLAMT